MQRSLTQGPITRNMLLFALPLMCGNLLQQMYNIADTWVVGRFLGADALAAVGSSYTLMTFLTSIVLGLCMGSGAVISMAVWRWGRGPDAAERVPVLCPHCGHLTGSQPVGLSGPQRHFVGAAGPGGDPPA